MLTRGLDDLPERVEIVPSASMGNKVEGVVEELIYLGDHIRCRLKVLGNDQFIVQVPNAHGHKHLKVGDTTKVSWNKEDCRALDA